MKTKFILILAISLSGIFYSCEKEEFGKNKDYEIVNVNESIIAGVWYHSYEIDSLVLVFEDKIMTEYIFNKHTKELLQRTEQGEYATYRRVYYNGKSEDCIYTNDTTSTLYYPTIYNISNNVLRLYYKNIVRNFYKVK